MSKLLVTSALPYANGRVHLGHLAGAYLPADTFVRWKRLQGHEVVFICGSDCYGIPITLEALKRGCTPKDVVDEYHAANGAAFAAANVCFDIWGRTDAEAHIAVTQQFFTRLHRAGLIVEHTIEQLYSEQSKLFLADRFVVGTCPKCNAEDARGDQCDRCGSTYEVTELKNPRCALPNDNSTPVLKQTRHWFLKLDALQKDLEAFVASHDEGTAQPWRLNTRRMAEGWLKMGLRERCITRDTSWGVPIPLDESDLENKRMYVWFDAPIGYVTFTQQLFSERGQPDVWRTFWQNPDCPIYNFIGKDNIPFHAIVWPGMQLGANRTSLAGEPDYQPVTQVVANEFLNFAGEKGSKSKGNAVLIEDFVKVFGADPLRYYLTAIAPEDSDSNFTWKDFAQRYNGELADVLGNFAHRTLTFAHKYFEGKVPAIAQLNAADLEIRKAIERTLQEVAQHYDRCRFRNALSAIMELARCGNRYFDEKAPWKQRKDDLAGCGTTIALCLETMTALALCLRPIMPESASKMLGMLNYNAPHIQPQVLRSAAELCVAGTALNTPEVLFRKIETTDLPGA